MTIIWYMVPETWSATFRIFFFFFSFWTIFYCLNTNPPTPRPPLSPSPLTTQKMKVLIIKKKTLAPKIMITWCINLTQSWCTNSGMAQTQITLYITEKVAFIITLTARLVVVMHMIFWQIYRRKNVQIKSLFESNVKFSYCKSFTGLGFYALNPRTPTAKVTQLHNMSRRFTPRMLFLTPKIGH